DLQHRIERDPLQRPAVGNPAEVAAVLLVEWPLTGECCDGMPEITLDAVPQLIVGNRRVVLGDVAVLRSMHRTLDHGSDARSEVNQQKLAVDRLAGGHRSTLTCVRFAWTSPAARNGA